MEHRNTQKSFGKARKLRREMEDWFARRNPNLELAGWGRPGAVDLCAGDTCVIGGPDRDN